MERLILGDNQFFGINHHSEEKARLQSMRFQEIPAMLGVLDQAIAEGISSFMCTTHEKIALLADYVRQHPTTYQHFCFLPCMPYAHKYANAVTEFGILGALQRFLPQEHLLHTSLRAGVALAKKDISAITTLLIDAEMSMFSGLHTPVIFLQNIVVDLLQT